MIDSILSGIIIGIMVSAPMGPIGMLCIQRTLSKGKMHGFITGIGASISDILYAVLVGFFMSFIVRLIEDYEMYIQVVGAVLIFGFGVHIFRSKPEGKLYSGDGVVVHRSSYWKDFVTGFALCFSNPLIIFLFIALYARFNFFSASEPAVNQVVGLMSISVGAVIWWAVLSLLIGLVRNRFTGKTMIVINMVIGVVLMVISVVGGVMAFL